MSPIDLLQSGLEHARDDRDPSTGALCQSILRQVLPLARELYLALSISERMRFDRDYATLFFTHTATQPPVNAEKMLELMRIGIVRLVKLGRDYLFTKKTLGPGYEFAYGERKSLRGDFLYVIDARSQERSVHTDTSQLTHNLIRRRLMHLDEQHRLGLLMVEALLWIGGAEVISFGADIPLREVHVQRVSRLKGFGKD